MDGCSPSGAEWARGGKGGFPCSWKWVVRQELAIEQALSCIWEDKQMALKNGFLETKCLERRWWHGD